MADFTCTAVGCYDYQSPQMHANIAALQTAINQFSQDPDYGFQPIAVDYVVGDGTTSALWVVLTNLMNLANVQNASQTGGLLASQATMFYNQINAPQDVMLALDQGDLLTFLQGAISSLGLPNNVPAPNIASNPTKLVTTTGSKATIANVKTQATKGNIVNAALALPPWLQILAGLALVGGGAYAYKKHKEKHG